MTESSYFSLLVDFFVWEFVFTLRGSHVLRVCFTQLETTGKIFAASTSCSLSQTTPQGVDPAVWFYVSSRRAFSVLARSRRMPGQ